MKYHECDQIAADTYEASLRFGCTLYPHVSEFVIEYVAERYCPGYDFEKLLEAGLDLQVPPLSEEERHGYKWVLGTTYSRRRHAMGNRCKEPQVNRSFGI